MKPKYLRSFLRPSVSSTGLALISLGVVVGAHSANAQTTTLTAAGSSAVTIGTSGSTTVASLVVNPPSTGEITYSSDVAFSGAPIASGSNNVNNLIYNSVSGNNIANFGELTVNGGAVRGTITANAGGNTRLVFDSLTLNNGGWFLFHRSTIQPGLQTIASQTAASANIVFTTAPTLSTSGTGSGTQTGVVAGSLVWSGANNARGIATYDSTYGLRALTSSETASLSSGMTANQNATLNGSATLSVNTSVNSLDIFNSTGTINMGGNTLTVSSGMVHFNQTGTIGADTGTAGTLDFGFARGYVSVENGRTGTINSVITGSGGLSIYLDTLNNTTVNAILAGANTFTGTTTVASNRNGQSLNLNNSLALQNSTLDYNNYGGSIRFNNGLAAFTFGGLQGAQTLDLNNNAAVTVALTVGGNNGNTTYSGSLTDTVDGGSLIKTGTGTLTLTGASNYTGGTTLNNGTLELGNAAAISTSAGAITFGGGTLKYGSGITTDYSSRIAAGTSASAMKIDTGASNVTFGTALTASQSGGLVKSGTGTLSLTNTANAFTGGITVANGALTASGSSGTSAVGINAIQLGDSSNSNVTLQLNNWNNLTSSNTINVVGSGTHTLIGNHNNTGQVHIAGGAITLNSNDFNVRNTNLSGWRINGGVTGTGNLQFENNNTGGTGNDISVRSALNNTGSITNAGTGAYNLTISGTNGGSVGANVTGIIQNSATSAFDLNAVISSFNTASVEVRAGSMLLNNTTSLRVANTVAVGSSGTLDVRQSNTIAGLNNISGSGGTVTNNSASDRVLTLGATIGSYSFAGALTDGATNKLGLTKSGSGTQALTGANTYTGATDVNGGILAINGNQSSASGAVTVASTATLKGTGTVGGATTIQTGGTMNAGAHSDNSPTPTAPVGKQTFSNDLTLDSQSIFAWDLSGEKDTATGTRGTDYDAVDIGGNFSAYTAAGTPTPASDAIFRVIVSSAFDFTTAFWDNNHTWSDIFTVTGSATGWAAGTAVDVNTYNFATNTYATANPSAQGAFTISGTTLTWTAVPEPTSALAGLLIGAGLLRRRRI
jgi:autotransporter-associated beta strand protein